MSIRPTRLHPAVWLSVASALSCAAPGGAPDLDDPDESPTEAAIERAFEESASGLTFPPIDCAGAALCSGPGASRQQCFAASAETSFRFEASQTFDVAEPSTATFARLMFRRLFSVAPDSPAVIRAEIRLVNGDLAAIATGAVLATSTIPATSLTSSTTSFTFTFAASEALQPPAEGESPKYALLLRVESGRASVGVACTDVVGTALPGNAAARKNRRVSGVSFENNAFVNNPRDLSFALGLAPVVVLPPADREWSLWPAPPISHSNHTTTADTVTDNLTGLVWQRAATADMTLAAATTYCDGLTLGGDSDWRLPTRIELLSILDRSRSYPPINVTAFPSTPQEGFWTSTLASDNVNRSWKVFFNLGESYMGNNLAPTVERVRCVR